MTFSTGCAATATSSGAGAAGQGVRHVRLLACAAQGVFYGGRGAGPACRGARRGGCGAGRGGVWLAGVAGVWMAGFGLGGSAGSRWLAGRAVAVASVAHAAGGAVKLA